MKPILLTLCGWGPYRLEEKVDFRLFDGRGLFLVTGATGAGKTTIFDAISYALYGNVSGDMREKDSVRSDFAGPETATYVELIMTHNGEKYCIQRNPKYVRPKKRKNGNAEYTEEKENAKLILPDGRIIQGSNDVTKKIQEILVLDYRQFKQISMIAQGEFAKLLTASPKEKIQIFREIFNTGIYDKFANILRKKASILYNEIMEYKHKMDEDISYLPLEDEEWKELTKGETYDYQKIVTYLLKSEQTMIQRENEVYEKVSEIEKSITELTENIANGKRDHELFDLLKESKEKLASLELQKEIYDSKKLELQTAKRAQAVEVAESNYKNIQNTVEKSRTNKEELYLELQKLKEEQQELEPFFLGKEIVEKWLLLVNDYTICMGQLDIAIKVLLQKEGELNKLQEHFLVVEKETTDKKKEYEKADLIYKRATVGIVIKMLKEGDPCPVCGSIDHPNVGKILEEIPNEEQLQTLKEEFEEAEGRHLELLGKVAAWKGETDRERELKHTVEEDLIKNQSLLLEAVHQTTNMGTDLFFILASVSLEECIELEKDKLQWVVQKVKQELKRKTERYLNINGLIGEKENAIHRLEDEIIQGKMVVQQKLKEFQGLLVKYEFANVLIYQGSKRDFGVLADLEKEVQIYFQAVSTTNDIIDKNQEMAKNKVVVNLEPLLEKKEEFLEQKKVLQDQIKQLSIQNSHIKKVKNSICGKLVNMNERIKEYGIVKDLDNLTSGNNPKRLVFEQYVLASYFEDILSAANLRFGKMTSMRYELSRVDGVVDGRSKDNLEIQVLDNYTGKYRSVKTLSGGESFKASLALALGMSDVIQSGSGGIRVETLFIDEGFGSLDAESLDQACETLNSLVDKERMIGIISHVGELRERIDNQIIVNKTNTGSYIKVVG